MVLGVSFLLVSCIKEQVPGSPDAAMQKKKIAEVRLDNTSMKLSIFVAYDSLFVGYNPLFISITDTATKTQIINATVVIKPVMDMMTMKHSCPVDQPTYNTQEQQYIGAAAFIMATRGMMRWTMEVITTVNEKKYTHIIPISVKATPPSIKLISSVKDQNNVLHYITLVHPQKDRQKVGINDLEVAVYQRSDMMNFPAVDGLSLSFVPTMPSMGHDSPNNVNPTTIEKGHYKGKVNFSMTGDWRLDFTISANGASFQDHAFLDILF